MKGKLKYFIMLHLIILLYSLDGICSKTAAKYDFLSPQWIFFYGCVICVLGVYAIAWQQILKHLPLVTSYANKAVTTIWGVVWGFLLFHEQIKINNIIGAVIIIFGVYLVVTGEEEEKTPSENKAKEEN